MQVFYSMVLSCRIGGRDRAAAGAASSPTSFPAHTPGRMSSPAHNADPLRPFDARMLSVGEGHWLYVEELGAPTVSRRVPARRPGQRTQHLTGGCSIRALPRLPVRSARRRAQPSVFVVDGNTTQTSSPTSRRSARTSASSAGSWSAARGARPSPSPMRRRIPSASPASSCVHFPRHPREVEWAFVDGPQRFRPDL